MINIMLLIYMLLVCSVYTARLVSGGCGLSRRIMV